MVYVVIFIALALAVFESKPLIRNKKWVELAAFSILMTAGAALLVLGTTASGIYHISTLIDLVFRPYTKLIEDFLTSF
jgi:hypothetical protein